MRQVLTKFINFDQLEEMYLVHSNDANFRPTSFLIPCFLFLRDLKNYEKSNKKVK